MEQGTVDDDPSRGTYDARSYSPEQQQSDTTRHREERSASTRRSNGGGDDTQADPSSSVNRSPHASRECSEHLAGPYSDKPVFPRVGATGDEIPDFEDAGIHLKEGLRGEELDGDEYQPRRHRMYKFTLYETSARYWVTGADISEKSFRMLRIERTSAPESIAVFEDETLYDRKQMRDVLSMIDQGNKATGGLRMKYVFWGLLGFIRFTEAYYMLVIKKRHQVAMIGGHYVYRIEDTELVPITTGASSRFIRDRNPEEVRFLGILNNLDLSKSFYFSYSYDITHSLQHNIIRQRQAILDGQPDPSPDFNAMFVWNHHLLQPGIANLKHPFDWCLPIIHGYIDQAPLSIFGRTVYLTIIGRRSRFFAGARFLKRGINDLGYVANDVETEQIVAEKLTTSFHAPGPRLFANPTYTSYLQHRGSIPLYWTQDNSGVNPKPDIDLNLYDPFYQPAALHFDNLFERYGCPIYVLNLIKARERQPRESKLLHEYESCVEYLNQSLPADKRIQYEAFDMSRTAKNRGDVIGLLGQIGERIVRLTGFFHNGDESESSPKVQNGIARTNCIDCLDRTNSAQFCLGKAALALQLRALGIIDRDVVEYDTDACNTFTQMFHDHGDTIAIQYGGSHLVNTVATYRKLNHWQSNSRDMVESFKRYYHNSFLDSQRQEAYNLFLGNYVWAQGQPMLWDLNTDYYLHHSDPKAWLDRLRRSYIYWFTPEFLEKRALPRAQRIQQKIGQRGGVSDYDDYWMECYRPGVLSTLPKVYAYRTSMEHRHLPEQPRRDNSSFNFSPFVRRLDPHRQHEIEATEKKTQRKGVKIVDPQEAESRTASPPHHPVPEATHRRPVTTEEMPSILREPTFEREDTPPAMATSEQNPPDKAQQHLWTLNQFHRSSLNPSISEQELHEYSRYVSHPLQLPLVVSNDLPSDANLEYVAYVHKPGGAAFGTTAYDEDEYNEHTSLASTITQPDFDAFQAFVEALDDPLTVVEEDLEKKRYKAYRQWLKGKSLFKQSKVDPEWISGTLRVSF
nr:polyphosphoinositide phosphatase [Quercus suber]